MKNFIEIEGSKTRTLINIKHIIRVKEKNKDGVKGCEIFLIDNPVARTVESVNLSEKRSRHEFKEQQTRIIVPLSYEEVKQKIIDATP